jgi:hypothetical protein
LHAWVGLIFNGNIFFEILIVIMDT